MSNRSGRPDIAAYLRQSSKGQLSYHPEWNQGELIQSMSPPKIRKPYNRPVYDLFSIEAALEAIEDDAVVYERNMFQASSKVVTNPTYNRDDGPVAQYGTEFDAFLEASDARLQEERRRNHFRRRREFEMFYADQRQKAEREQALMRKMQYEKRAREAEEHRRYLRACEESAQRIEQESREHQDRLIKTRLQEQEERRLKLQLLENQREEQEKKRFCEIFKCVEGIRNIQESVSAEIANFQHQQALAGSNVPQLLDSQAEVFKLSRDLFSGCASVNRASTEHLEQMLQNLQQMKEIQAAITVEISAIQSRVQLEDQKKARALKEAKLEEERRRAEQVKKDREAAEKSGSELNVAPLPNEFKFCVSPASYQLYVRLKEKREQYEQWGRELTKSSDRNTKKLTMELSKAISVPVSSITDRSGSELKSRLRTLTSILKGQSVPVGNKSISTNFSPIANKFAVNLIARKIVQQAADQISANFNSAFCIAFLVVGLWAESSEFGELFMAHLHSRCVYTVPFYIPKLDGQSDEDHQKALGYNIDDDGTVEGQDKYLKRMSGLVRLHAAIIQSPLPPGVSDHPHHLGEGWAWIARMLNLEPNPGVSATVLYDFLIVAGHALMGAYRSQFEKLLYVICHDYFPRLEEVTSAGQRVPVIRLKSFLEKCVKLKSVPIPEGRLDKTFWNTYYSGELVGN